MLCDYEIGSHALFAMIAARENIFEHDAGSSMKRLSEKQRAHMVWRSVRGNKSRKKTTKSTDKKAPTSRRVTNYHRKSSVSVELQSYRGKEVAKVFGGVKPVPKILSLQKNFDETAEFLGSIRSGFVKAYEKFGTPKSSQHLKTLEISEKYIEYYYDFSMIEEISAPVALIMASEYDCYQRNGGMLPGAVNLSSWKPEVRAMLEGVGFLDMAGVKEIGPAYISGKKWKVLRFRSGSEADGEQVDSLLRDLGVQSALDNAELYSAIVEALINTRHHAYPRDHEFQAPHYPGWWLTGYVNDETRRIRISVYDRGLSIPGTLITWDKYPIYDRLWKRVFSMSPDPQDASRDGTAISLAMETGRTSTGEGYRGKGLPSMEEALDLCVDGHLTIYSRSGEYRRWKGRAPHHVNRSASIGGTLVSWDLRF